MELKIANAPCSWGVEFADSPANPAWQTVLDEISGAGYLATELGPLGYLPTETDSLGSALSKRSLKLIAGTLFVHLHREDERENICRITHETCRILTDQDAEFLVVIDHVSSPRTDEAGQVETATRLNDRQWQAMMETLKEVGRICLQYGITPTLHPHAGTYIEYRDEVDRAMADLPADLISLCIDTGHCVYAGMDPAEVIKTYQGRVKYLHFKDINGSVLADSVKNSTDFYKAIGNNIFCPLGRGCVDFNAVHRVLTEINFNGWVTVEQDMDPASGNDAKKAAAQSRQFIETTFFSD